MLLLAPGMQVMACCKKEHLTEGRTYLHVAEPPLQDLGRLDIEADAPCVPTTNNFRQAKDSGNNITGQTVLMKANAHGMTTINLNLDAGQNPVDRAHPDYCGPYAFAFVYRPELMEWRYKHGVDDLESMTGIVEDAVAQRYEAGTTSEDVAKKVKDQSTYFPLPLAFQQAEALSSRNYTSADLEEDEPGAYVDPEPKQDPPGSGQLTSLV
jgi:hypothetical protein